MLNRNIVIGILGTLNLIVFVLVAKSYGLTSLNNWLLIASIGFFSLGIYRVLGMVEGYRN